MQCSLQVCLLVRYERVSTQFALQRISQLTSLLFFVQCESMVVFPIVFEESFNWLFPVSGQLGRIGTGNFSIIEYGQYWHNIMRCNWAWKVFFQVDNKWCTHFLLECADLVCTNVSPVSCWRSSLESESCKTQFVAGVMASSSRTRTASSREEVLDRSRSFIRGVLLS